MTLPVARSHCVAWIAGGLLAAGATPAMAEAVEGHAVSRDGEVATAFQWRVENCDGRMRSEWRTASGQMIAWDEVEFEAGHFLRYRLVRPNLGQDLTLHSSDKRTLGGPMLIEFARHWLGSTANCNFGGRRIEPASALRSSRDARVRRG